LARLEFGPTAGGKEGKRKEKGRRGGLGWRVGKVLDRFLFFSSFFQILFKQNSNLFKIKSFTQLSPTFHNYF
jgi:hypothetical protein